VRYMTICLAVLFLLALGGCGAGAPSESSQTPEISSSRIPGEAESPQSSQAASAAQVTSPGGSQEGAGAVPDDSGEVPEWEPEEIPVVVEVGDRVFSGVLYNQPAAQDLAARLPLTLEMQELNGNEKYHFFSQPLSADARGVEEIRTGDLMLYQDNCLVLFYQTFPTTYRYTPLGRLNETDSLAEALGSGPVTVTIRVETP
jgi:hypothetical protein